MAIDTKAPLSRRGLLAAVVGGTAAALAGVASRAERAFAAGSDGETVVVGGQYGDVRTVTELTRQVDTHEALIRLVGLDDGLGEGRTHLGAHQITLHRGGIFAGSASSRLGPAGLLLLSSNRASGEEHRTLVGSEGITTAQVSASSKGATAVTAKGRIGGSFAGRKAQIRLQASDRPTHPATGARGDLFVDARGRLWFCKGDRNWKQLA